MKTLKIPELTPEEWQTHRSIISQGDRDMDIFRGWLDRHDWNGFWFSLPQLHQMQSEGMFGTRHPEIDLVRLFGCIKSQFVVSQKPVYGNYRILRRGEVDSPEYVFIRKRELPRLKRGW